MYLLTEDSLPSLAPPPRQLHSQPSRDSKGVAGVRPSTTPSVPCAHYSLNSYSLNATPSANQLEM
eukprot:3187973-Prymnesium_polylepis.1